MNLKDITILRSLSPITVLEEPNQKTIAYLAKPLQEPSFIEFLKVMRTQHSFPAEGLNKILDISVWRREQDSNLR